MRTTRSQDRLVASLIALGNFVGEIRSTSGREEIMALTISHLKALFPIQSAGFYFPRPGGLDFTLQTPLPADEASRLTSLVEQAIDSGEFGWALNHYRPAAFKSGDGQTTLLLAALRTRQRALGMFAAILSSNFEGWAANSTALTTHLAFAADAMLAEELTAKLQEHNRQLNSLVLERTQQFHEAKEAAELANRAKSTFLATISHELRTPLNAILGYTQIMLSHERSASERDQLNTIQVSAEHLLSLINELLDIAKAEASAIEITPQTVSLQKVLNGVIGIARPQAEAKALVFRFTAEAGLPQFIVVDPKRLKQVLLNLLGNAIKFTVRGSVQIAVSRNQQCLRFAVSDTGRGIAGEDLPKLFQPFQRLGDATGNIEGTGLGLSITKRIMDLLGVVLQVQSELGKGSCFWFDLDCEAPGSGGSTVAAVLGSEAATAEPPASAVVLPPENLRVLKELSADGDILELQKELARMVEHSPNPLARRLLQLATECRVKAIRELLETYERDHPDR